MDSAAKGLDCPLCGTPIHLLRDDVIVVCPMCGAAGVPFPGVLDPLVPAMVGSRR